MSYKRGGFFYHYFLRGFITLSIFLAVNLLFSNSLDAAHLRPLASYEKESESTSFTVQIADIAETPEQEGREGLVTFLRLATDIGSHSYADDKTSSLYLSQVGALLRLLVAYHFNNAKVLVEIAEIKEIAIKKPDVFNMLADMTNIKIGPAKMDRIIGEAAKKIDSRISRLTIDGEAVSPKELFIDFYNNKVNFLRNFSSLGPQILYECRKKFYELEMARLNDKLELAKPGQRYVEVEMERMEIDLKRSRLEMQKEFNEGTLEVSEIKSIQIVVEAWRAAVFKILDEYPDLREKGDHEKLIEEINDSKDYLAKIKSEKGLQEVKELVDRSFPPSTKAPDLSLHKATLSAI